MALLGIVFESLKGALQGGERCSLYGTVLK